MRLRHYIKVAWRNLLKYRVQSLISVVGLAIGFTFFALSAFWVRYERMFDSFHPDADRILKVNTFSDMARESRSTPYPLTAYMRENYPEIEAVTTYDHFFNSITIDHTSIPLRSLAIDSSFMQVFGMQLLSGNRGFLVPENQQIAISDSKAKEIFGSLDVLDKTVQASNGNEYTIGAIFKDWGQHTGLPFDALGSEVPTHTQVWSIQFYQTYIKIRKEVDCTAFQEKLRNAQIGEKYFEMSIPTYRITEMRYSAPEFKDKMRVQHNYLYFFLIAGGMIILAAFLNFFTLFVSNTRIRVKEFVLRLVNGSSRVGVARMMLVELLLTLLFSLILGMIFIELILPAFCELSGIQATKGMIYIQSLVYILSVILLFVLLCNLLLRYFSRRTLQSALRQDAAISSRNLFRKASVVLQLVVGILLIFCTVVMIRQILLLKNGDIGLDYKNRGSLSYSPKDQAEEINHRISQFSQTEEILVGYDPLVPQAAKRTRRSISLDSETQKEVITTSEEIYVDESYIRFYNFRLKQGRMLADDDPPEYIMINEATAREKNWHDAIGKEYENCTVIGVIQDFYSNSTTELPQPVFFSNKNRPKPESGITTRPSEHLLVKVYDGQWKAFERQIWQLMQEEYPGVYYILTSSEEHYQRLFRSEDALMKVLTFTAVICILICLFGIYSLVTLTCEERRREIGIRKVNGATLADILRNMLREYLLLLVVASAIAFPLGYVIIKPWVEQYIRQTSITPWLFISLFIGLAFVVLASIYSRVLKAARTNPAEVIRNE